MDLRQRLSDSSDLREVLTLCAESSSDNAMMLTFSDLCLAEICQIDVNSGPLIDFPPSVNENVYSKTVAFGIQCCPNLMGFVINMVVRRNEPVVPSDVFKIATLFSSICYAANQDIDGLGKFMILNVVGSHPLLA